MRPTMTLPRALAGWVLLFGIACVNGAFRDIWLVPRLGEHTANQVSCGTGILLFAVAVWALGRVWPWPSGAFAWRVGLLWLGMTVIWEFVFGRYVAGHSWQRLLADYAVWNGRLWVVVLLWVLVAPAATRAFDVRVRRGARAAGRHA